MAAGLHRCQPARDGGFTLVEVLVALLIMAVVAGMGWQGVSAMTQAREIATAASERALRLATVVAQWEQDLAAVYDSPQVPGLSFDGAALRIVRRFDDGVGVVVWSVRQGVWRRWPGAVVTRQGDLQQAWLASQQLQGPEPGQLRLLEAVGEWQIYFWRDQGWSNAQSSGDVQTPVQVPGAPGGTPGAAPVAQVKLPLAVRLQIDLPEGRLLRDVLLPPQFSGQAP